MLLERRCNFVAPAVFQAAGPKADDISIQSAVDAFRAALGEPKNGNSAGLLPSGRREINWDGGGNNDTTTAPVTPFDVFLNTRCALFTTPGTGLSQAPPSGGPQGGLAGLFNKVASATCPRRAAGASTLHAMLLDPAHGPIDQLPLPKESRRGLADKGGCQLMCGFIGGPKRREIVGLQQW